MIPQPISGCAACHVPYFVSGAIRGKSFAIVGFVQGYVPRDKSEAVYNRLIELATSGELVVERETLPLDWVGEAWKRQKDSPHRKLVLVP